MNAGQQELRRVAVPKVVEPDAREVGSEPGKEAWKFMRQALRLQRCAITTGTSEHIPGLTDPKREKVFRLLAFQSAQLLHCVTW